MLAWPVTISLLCSAVDATEQAVELPEQVTALVKSTRPELLLHRLTAMGEPALCAAWAVELGLASDPRTPAPVGATSVWTTLLDGAAAEPLLEALDETLPELAQYTALRAAVQRLSEHSSPKVVPFIADLLHRLPAASLQSERTGDWITDSLIRYAEDRFETRAALELHFDRFPGSTHAALDLALLESGSYTPLGRWESERMPDRELARRLRGLSRLRPGFQATRDVIDLLERLLRRPEPLVQVRAIEGIIALGATELIPDLMDRSRHAPRRVARTAMRALTELGHVRWPRSLADWQTWWDSEQHWIEDEWPAVLDDLMNGTKDRRAHSLRLILEHPALAHVTAAAIGDAAVTTSDEAFALRLIGCLGALREPSAYAALLSATEDDRTAVRDAALAILER